MSRKVRRIKKKNTSQVKKEPQEQKALVAVKKDKLKLSNIYNKKVLKKTVKTVSIALIVAIVIANLIVIVLAFTSIFYIYHLQNGLIQKGVFVNGINIAGTNSDEAIDVLFQDLNQNISDNIILKYKENTYQLNLKELGLQFEIEDAVKEAYSIGRTKNVVKDLWDYAKVINDTVNIKSEIQYNEEFLNQYINSISEQLPDKVQEFTYSVENNVLTVNKGKNGIELNGEELKGIILSNLSDMKYDEEIEIPVYETLPKSINLRKNI